MFISSLSITQRTHMFEPVVSLAHGMSFEYTLEYYKTTYLALRARTQVQSEMKTSGVASKWALANQLNVSKWALAKWFKSATSVNELSAGEVACNWYIVETRRNREENLNRWREQILKLKSRLLSLIDKNSSESSSSEFTIRSSCSSFTDPNSKMYNRFKKKYQNAGQRHVRLSVETVRRKEVMSRMQRNAHNWNLWNKTRFYVLEDDVPSNQPDRVVYRNVSRRIKLTLGVAENAPPGSKVAFTYVVRARSAKPFHSLLTHSHLHDSDHSPQLITPTPYILSHNTFTDNNATRTQVQGRGLQCDSSV